MLRALAAGAGGPGAGRAGAGGAEGRLPPPRGRPAGCSVPAAREEETAGRAGSSGAAPPRRSSGGRQLRAPPLPPPAPRAPGPMAGPAAPWAALLLLAALLPAALPGTRELPPHACRCPAGRCRGAGGSEGTRCLGMPRGAALCPRPARGRAPRGHPGRGGRLPSPAQAPAAAPGVCGLLGRCPRAGTGAAEPGKAQPRGLPGSRRAAGTLRDPPWVSPLRLCRVSGSSGAQGCSPQGLSWPDGSRWHRRVTASRLPSARGCLFPHGTSLVPPSRLGSAEEPLSAPVSGADTGQRSAASPGKPGEISPLFSSFPPPESRGSNPESAWARLALLSELPGPAGSGLSCSGGGRGCGRQWQMCPVLSLVDAVSDHLSPRGAFCTADDAEPNLLSLWPQDVLQSTAKDRV